MSAALIAIMVLAVALPAWGQEKAAEDQAPTLTLTVHPAAAPQPALKYQFLPTVLERHPGNAAVIYGKVTAEQTPLFSNNKLWDWITSVGMEAPLAELRKATGPSGIRLPITLPMLDWAARCDYCDWQLPIREQPFYEILLPDIQQSRTFARLLAANARMQMADGKYEEAIHTLTTGYALGGHVGEGPCLVSGLVGLAISGVMSEQVKTFVQQPGAPNLYWALASLPRPLVDIRPAVEAERDAVYLSYPELRPTDGTGSDELPPTDEAHWRRVIDCLSRLVTRTDDVRPYVARAYLTLMSLKQYPMAKAWLADHGFSPEQVEAMPVPEVIGRYTLATYNELRDETFKWFYVPYPKAGEGMKRAEEALKRSAAQWREIVPLAAVTLPAVLAVRTAVARTDREVAALEAVEAMRMYAATHDGRLPERLDEITQAPVPDDPVTGAPFAYELRGQSALLSGPPLPGARMRWEIKMVR